MPKYKDKIKEFSRLSMESLNNFLLEKREKMREFRFDLAAGKIKDVRTIREARKDIARIKTFIRKGELEAKHER